MRKFATLFAVCAFAFGIISCQSKGEGDAEADAVYEDEAYDIDDAIDPDEDEFYSGESGFYEEEGYEEEEYVLPEDDILDSEITDSSQVDKLLDSFDDDIDAVENLMERYGADNDEVQERIGHIISIADKMNECAEEGFVTVKQLNRYTKQSERFTKLVKRFQ